MCYLDPMPHVRYSTPDELSQAWVRLESAVRDRSLPNVILFSSALAEIVSRTRPMPVIEL